MGARLCDFGSARMGFSAAVARPRSAHAMLGSPGYVDPHYLRTGVLTKKSDVYSFGVLLLELVTGAEAFSANTEQLLTAVIGPRLRDLDGDVGDLVDPRLGREYELSEATAIAALAARCIGGNPSMRPSMAEVVQILQENVAASISAGGEGSDGNGRV
uniref:Protein kinase domain-containing protein n=2 Tax=Ananas comosus TaxID=4615 RepID=A0A6V7PZL8_ANACO|nr:unnamed protein product [Ananas comosus var. bracteatus]